jgi:hypothetical protein
MALFRWDYALRRNRLILILATKSWTFAKCKHKILQTKRHSFCANILQILHVPPCLTACDRIPNTKLGASDHSRQMLA